MFQVVKCHTCGTSDPQNIRADVTMKTQRTADVTWFCQRCNAPIVLAPADPESRAPRTVRDPRPGETPTR